MQIIVRAATAAVFFALMFGVKHFAHVVVDLGALVWLIVIGAIFWAGIKLENRHRLKTGREPYSWQESRELVTPLACLAGFIVVAYWLR